MSDEKVIGYAIQHQFAIDPEVQEGITMHYNAPADATPFDLAKKMRDASIALWTRRLVANDRIVERTKLIHAERQARIAEAQKNKVKLDLRSLAEDETQMRTALVRLESQQAADVAVLERERTMTDADMESLIARVERSTFGDTTH